MAALVVQSRFAGLKIEDDDYPHPHPQSSSGDSQKTKKNKTNTAKKIEPSKKTKNNGNNNKSQGAAKKKKTKQGQASDNQWEMWKQKDEELVDGNFECELQQAILLSKLDYEEKKDVYKQLKKEADTEKKMSENTRTNNKKQKKKNVMSLEQFNDMMNNGDENKATTEEETTTTDEIKIPDKDTEFFERVKDETKHELLKDKINDRVRNSQAPSDAFITRVQFAYMLEKKNEEIAALQEEVSSLKQELRTVKSRNKKLCGILGQGEMKDKAEVLVEVERLRAVQAELTAEIATLHSDLEKERSKNTDPRSKDKKYNTKKKNIRFDVSSEAIPVKDASSAVN
ncbi:hypothetical protein O3G_MSEX003624 [Manduca sexta]|uniref:G kinase-anchoring protein 1 n=1 Tax=Manduca sexta TaxID=7130 RepID=A0A921YTW8_MANSE|nr:hypothetical protein O3G_MSEX003624 [Manduca sexta]